MNPQQPPLPGQSAMPFGIIAAKSQSVPNLLPPVPKGGQAPPPIPPPAMNGPAPSIMPPASPMGAPMTALPNIAPPKPAFVQQADGSVAVTWPAPDGSPQGVVSQVYPTPKTPPAFQAPKPPAPPAQ